MLQNGPKNPESKRMYPPVSQHQILRQSSSAHRSKGCVARGRAQDSWEDCGVTWKKRAGESSVQKRLVRAGSRNPCGNHWIIIFCANLLFHEKDIRNKF